jgi:DNA-binding NarL/FixJ family response regulator
MILVSTAGRRGAARLPGKGFSVPLTVRIAVVDPLPMYQQGVAAVLAEAGYRVELPDDLLAWLQRRGEAVVVLTLRSEDDWNLLRRVRAEPPPPRVIVLLDDDRAATGIRAMRVGAWSVLPRGVTVRTLRRTVEATVSGQAVMPAEVALALATAPAAYAEMPPTGPPSTLSGDQMAWLRQLANGSTVAQVADRAGYSERAMFRLLRAVYERLGSHSRIEAIMRAKEAGWL